MKDITALMYGKSLAGHDKGTLYIIWEVEGEYVYLVNGKNKTIQNPKKKKVMHIQADTHIDERLLDMKENNITIRNEDIVKAIKNKNGDLKCQKQM